MAVTRPDAGTSFLAARTRGTVSWACACERVFHYPTAGRGYGACTQFNCGRSFTHSTQKVLHVRKQHTGERPFACSYDGCGKAFFASGQLKDHTRAHTGEKLAQCPQCNKMLRCGVPRACLCRTSRIFPQLLSHLSTTCMRRQLCTTGAAATRGCGEMWLGRVALTFCSPPGRTRQDAKQRGGGAASKRTAKDFGSTRRQHTRSAG